MLHSVTIFIVTFRSSPLLLLFLVVQAYSYVGNTHKHIHTKREREREKEKQAEINNQTIPQSPVYFQVYFNAK